MFVKQEPPIESYFTAESVNLINNEPNVPSTPTYNFWQIEYWTFIFDVNTTQVGKRLLFSLFPYPKFFEVVQSNPDLYGPWWIATTLIFVLAVAGNVVNYFHAENVSTWYYDTQKLSVASGTIYSYLLLIPLGLTGLLRYCKLDCKVIDVMCLYGYSFTIYIPVSIVCAFPITGIRWTFIGIAAPVSTGFLLANFFGIVRQENSKLGLIILSVMALFHVSFAAVCQFYFFVP